jgi:hypothetical protein
MAFAVVTHAAQGSTDTNGFTSSSFNSTGANLLVLVLQDTDGTTAVSDSKGNTWHQAVQTNQFDRNTIFYAWNPTVGSGHTITLTATSKSPSFEIIVLSGAQTSSDPLDQTNSGVALGGGTIQPGSITPGSANEIVIAGVTYQDTTNAMTINSSFTIQDQQKQVNGAHVGGGLAYIIQTTAGAVNPTWTDSGNQLFGATIASFLSGGGAPPAANGNFLAFM